MEAHKAEHEEHDGEHKKSAKGGEEKPTEAPAAASLAELRRRRLDKKIIHLDSKAKKALKKEELSTRPADTATGVVPSFEVDPVTPAK